MSRYLAAFLIFSSGCSFFTPFFLAPISMTNPSPRKKTRTGLCKETNAENRGESGKGKTLYDMLQVPKTASKAEIKKAYYALAKEVNPVKPSHLAPGTFLKKDLF